MADEPSRGLRVVPTGGVPKPLEPVTMVEAIVALAAQIAALNPTLFMITFEHPPGKLNIRTIPEPPYVAEILASRAHDMLRTDIEAEN